MKISSKGRYALRMMIDIAEHSGNEWVNIKDIAARQGISVKYLEQIVTNLTKSGLLRSGRGAHGGYMLTRPPEQYKVGQILRAIEGNLAPVACLSDEVNQCERNKFCPTINFWKEFYETIDNYVDSVTLRELINPKNTGEDV